MNNNLKTLPNAFDYFDIYEIPNFILCNPNKDPLCSLSGIKNRCLKLSLTEMSTLTFTALPKVENIDMDYYEKIKANRLICVEDVGYFTIKSVVNSNDGLKKTKEVTAYSLECELVDKNVNLTTGTYKFYDLFNPEDSLLGKVISNVPNWSIGEIDSDLMNKWRYYEVNNDKIYNFLMTTVSEALECVFVFDTFNRTISAYTVEHIISPTSIYMSHDNLIKNAEVTESIDELYTSIDVSGKNDLSIWTVNPLGNSKIYDFTYCKNTDWMTQELINAIDAWEHKVEIKTAEHQELIKQYYNCNYLLNGDPGNPDDSGYYGQMTHLEEELSDLEVVKGTKVSEGLSLTDINKQIKAKKQEINNLQTRITPVEQEVEDALAGMNVIASELSFKNNFSEELYKELSLYIKETSYNNTNYTKTDTMHVLTIIEQAQGLYDQAKEAISRFSRPQYTYTLDSVNFLFLKPFLPFSNQLKMGLEATVEIDEGVLQKPILLQIELNYDDPNDFSLTFGYRTKMNDPNTYYADLMGQLIAAGQSVALNSSKWDSYSQDRGEISNFIKSSLDLTKNSIISTKGQNISIDETGYRGKKKLENGKLDSKELWLSNNTLAFTKDSWETASLALGEIQINGQYVYGLIADAIIGKILAGDQLIIANENNSFTVDGQQATLINAILSVISKNGVTRIFLDPDNGLKIQKKVPNTELYEDVLYADVNGNLHLTGNINATDGIFKGTVQAQRYLDAAGNDMFVNNKFQPEYLELKGLNVNNNFLVDENGRVTINGGNISFGSVNGLENAMNKVQNTANKAYDNVTDLANGEFSGGTFIDGNKIYSPEIYSNHFKVIPENAANITTRPEYDKGFSAYETFGGGLGQQFLNIQAYDAGSHPCVFFSSPYGAYAMWEFNYTTFSKTLCFSGTCDFSKAKVEGLTCTFA